MPRTRREYHRTRTLSLGDLLERMQYDYKLYRMRDYNGTWRYTLKHIESGRTIELKEVFVLREVRAGYITAHVSLFDENVMIFEITKLGATILARA